jgi:hypothetical protein
MKKGAYTLPTFILPFIILLLIALIFSVTYMKSESFRVIVEEDDVKIFQQFLQQPQIAKIMQKIM